MVRFREIKIAKEKFYAAKRPIDIYDIYVEHKINKSIK